MARVSVVMPAYNAGKYITQAMESILAQTYQDWELIIIDDGSMDETWEVVTSHPQFGGPVIIKGIPHGGIVAALNFGLKMANGEYIARQDADDYSDPRRLQMQVDFLEAFPDYGIHGTGMLLIDSKDFPKRIIRHPLRPTMDDLMQSCCVSHPTVMFRRDVYEKIGGYDPDFNHNCCEDYDYWLRAREHFKIFNSSCVCYTKREHEESNIGRLISKGKRDVIHIYDDLARIKARIRAIENQKDCNHHD